MQVADIQRMTPTQTEMRYKLRRHQPRRRILYGLQSAMYWSGAGSVYSACSGRDGAVVLMYHSVAGDGTSRFIDPRLRITPTSFERHMRFLARYRNVIGMSDLLTLLERGRTPCRKSVIITFDDGYADTLEVAAPILRRYSLPATVYLPTGCVARAETHWVDRLYTMFSTRTRDVLHLHLPDGSRYVNLSSGDASQVYQELCDRLIVTLPDEREALLQEFGDQLRPDHSPPRLTMDWTGVRALLKHYPQIAIGVHTVDHLDLTAHSQHVIEQQIGRCITDIRTELGVRAEHFSFPYGRASSRSRTAVERAGLRSAVAAGTDYLIDSSADHFALPRIDVAPTMTLFRFWTSGAYPGLSMTLLGRA